MHGAIGLHLNAEAALAQVQTAIAGEYADATIKGGRMQSHANLHASLEESQDAVLQGGIEAAVAHALYGSSVSL